MKSMKEYCKDIKGIYDSYKTLIDILKKIESKPFKRVTYKDCIKILQDSGK